MKKNIIIMVIAVLTAPMTMLAQNLNKRGTTLTDLVPEGWEHSEAAGDMNGDGIADLAIIAIPNNKENIMVREDGYERNLNRPILAIYFGEKQGGYALFRQYDEAIPAPSEYVFIDTSLKIDDNGMLRVGVNTFLSAGSSDTGGPTYVFHYQDGDFYLVAKEEEWMSRNSGEIVEASENYITNKRHVKYNNSFSDSKKSKKEATTDISPAPLQRLGDFEL